MTHYRVAWHYRTTEGLFHSGVLESLAEAKEYSSQMAAFCSAVWIEKAEWKRVDE